MKNKHAHILLVEDDPLDVANALRAFQAIGIENPVHVANDGKTALDMLLGRGRPALSPKPKIILLDLNLPEMSGLEFLTRLREEEKFKCCSVFVLTAHDSEHEILKAYDLNVAGYILKPLHYQSFQEMVKTLHTYWNLIELPN